MNKQRGEKHPTVGPIRIPADLLRRVRTLARAEDRTIASIIRVALAEYMKRPSK